MNVKEKAFGPRLGQGIRVRRNNKRQTKKVPE